MEDIDFIIKLMDDIKAKLINNEKITDQELRNFDLLLKNKRLLQDQATSIQGYSAELTDFSTEQLKKFLNGDTSTD